VVGKLIDYFRHSFDPGNYRVVMTLLVKNEIDIIEANIRVHAALGVDSFVVMDHGSSDGTREALESLRGKYDLHIIDQQDPVYRQSEWMTQLAEHARDKLAADWVISNDADEFWLPRGGQNLKQLLAFKGTYLTCRRYNMVLDHDALQEGYRFYDAGTRVDNPIFYGNDDLNREPVAIVLSKIGPKVIANPHGLLKIKGGNHRAKHAAKLLEYHKPYDRIGKFEPIAVYHYPLRGYKQFEGNVLHRKTLLAMDPAVRMGNHYRRWVDLHRQGRLEEEYGRYVFTGEELRVLKKYGVVVEDEYPGLMIRKALGCEESESLKIA
jgi:hypothetical protein